MAESSLFWGGTDIGDAGPYSDDQFSDFIRDIMQSDPETQGVLKNKLNELAATNPAGTTIRIASGKAIVDGKSYESTSDVDFEVSAPGAGSNYYTVVLRKNFAAQTIRLVLLGPNAVTYPSVTQTEDITWEIEIARVSITSGGVISITDVRVYATPTISVSTADIQDDAVTPVKLNGINSNPAGDRILFWDLTTGTFQWLQTGTGISISGTSLNVLSSDSLVVLKVIADTEALTTGDGKMYFPIPPEFNGKVISSVYGFIYTKSTSGTPTIQIARGRRATPTSDPTWVDVLSTLITIDVNEFSSTNATTPPVVDPNNDDLVTADLLRIDIDGIGTGSKGLDIGLVIS